MKRLLVVMIAAWVCSHVSATPYWIAWEGDDFPENQGWSRSWGNWNGPHQGGAIRSLEDGVLTYDSLYDAGVYDFSYIDNPGWAMDPQPGELFVMEWRVKVDAVTGWYRDPSVAIAADTRWMVGFEFGVDHVASAFEDDVIIPIAPNVFHGYQLRSWDMRGYELYIDGELARIGEFWQSATDSYVGWGDGTQGAASLHQWDYFRLGVVPEAQSFLQFLGAVIACFACRRR